MINVLILHGKGNNSGGNWFPWLKNVLEKKGYKVWVPDLPEADKPNTRKFIEHIKNKKWKFDKDSIIIGHSSGAVAILGILQDISKKIKIDTCILVGSFIATEADSDWDDLKGLFEEPFDFENIKKRSKRFIFVHSKDDPYCPPEQAEYLCKKLGGKLVMKENEGHFNLEKSKRYRKFPLLLELLEEE